MSFDIKEHKWVDTSANGCDYNKEVLMISSSIPKCYFAINKDDAIAIAKHFGLIGITVMEHKEVKACEYLGLTKEAANKVLNYSLTDMLSNAETIEDYSFIAEAKELLDNAEVPQIDERNIFFEFFKDTYKNDKRLTPINWYDIPNMEIKQ